MDFALPAELVALREEALAVGRAATAKCEFTEDSWIVGHDRALAVELAERGWIGMTWPTEYGGGGRSKLERHIVSEALIETGAPIASCWFADRQMGPTLLEYGTEEQKRRWIPDIIAGKTVWCIGMSEPDAGSDVASFSTRAVRDGDEFVVNGQKIWNSGGADADWIYLICRTDPDAPKHKGLSELIVDMHAPGVTVTPIRDMTDSHHFCEIFFDDVRVPAGHLVGELNGSFGQVMRQMQHERGGIDRLVSNKRLYDDCLRYADTDDPLVRQRIARIETMFRIGRLLVLREVMGQAPENFSAATKTACTEFEQEVAYFCADVLGSRATITDDPLYNRVVRNVAYAPAYTIMGGTTEILRNILGERSLGLPREPRP